MGLAAVLTHRSDQLQDRLDLLTIQIGTLLDSLAGAKLLEARRTITRVLHFEPRAEELQTMVRMAADECVVGPRREIPLLSLATRILSDRLLKSVQEARTIDADTMNEAADLLAELLDESRRQEVELGRLAAVDAGLDPRDRDYLLRAGEAFAVSPDDLLANAVLARRLGELAARATEESLEIAEPWLTAEERARIGDFTAKNITRGSCRVELDAIAIRTHTERLLVAWDESGPPSEDDDTRRAERNALLEKMQDAHVALDSVSARIQVQQDAALVADVGSLADELRDAGRGLFTIKLRLVPILRSPYEDSPTEISSEEDLARLREELAESAAEEQAIEGGPRGETEDEIYLGALKNMRTRKQEQELEFQAAEKLSDAQRGRRRMIAMVVAACVLAITSAIVNFAILPGSKREPVKPEVQELRPPAHTRRVETAGPMMITHVDGWNDLDDTARQSQVDHLGKVISPKGFQMMIVVDEYGDVAAVWDKQSGSGLLETPE